jgi:hypothetical protein
MGEPAIALSSVRESFHFDDNIGIVPAMITFRDLSPNVEVIAAGAPPPLPAPLEAEVAALWNGARIRRPDGLHDGRLFAVEAMTPSRITGRFVPYRRLVAQRANPALFAALGVRPLAVSGLLTCANGIVFGRRAAGVTDDPDRWELVPSGGVSPECADVAGRVDLGRQILAELVEETGLDSAEVAAPEILCAVENDRSHVIDVGIALTTALSGAEVLARHARRASREYVELAVVAKADVPAFVAARERGLIAVSRALLDRIGLTSAR